MSGNRLALKLTADQQRQIQAVTGNAVAELNIDLAGMGGLSQEELDQVAGGIIVVCQKVAPAASSAITDGSITDGSITNSTISGSL